MTAVQCGLGHLFFALDVIFAFSFFLTVADMRAWVNRDGGLLRTYSRKTSGVLPLVGRTPTIGCERAVFSYGPHVLCNVLIACLNAFL